MTDNESIVYDTENELLQIISDGASRDMRRYPSRFNIDDEQE